MWRFTPRPQLLILTCSLLLSGFSAQAAQTTDPAPDLTNIEFVADVRVFAVMAALNAAGFDYEGPGREMSSVRQAVRSALQRADSNLIARLRAFYSAHKSRTDESDEHIAYTSLALMLAGPPSFDLAVQEEEVPPDVWRIRDFASLVGEFYQGAGIESLWTTFRSAYDQELASYRSVVGNVAVQTLNYFRIPARAALDRRIILIPDLLNAKQIVNARNLEHTYYIVAGPTDNASENHQQIQHAYLHFLIDPLIEKFGLQLLTHSDLMELAQSQPNLNEELQYKFFLIVAESLIESVVLKLHPPSDFEVELVELFREGLIFTPYFLRGLERYERETELISFPSYVETLFKEIDDSVIKADSNMIDSLESERRVEVAERTERQAEESAQEAQRNRINGLLNEAAVFLSKEQFDEAEQTVAETLRLDPGNPSAYFYRAQIASRRNEYEAAAEDYERAATSTDAPIWIRAWSWVRIGNYLAFQKRFSDARNYFEQVLELKGDLRGAQSAATRSLEQLSQERP